MITQTASYRNSRAKKDNRKFKSRYARKAFRTERTGRALVAYSLCGDDITSELSWIKYAQARWGEGALTVNSYNTTADEFAIAERKRLFADLSLTLNLNLHPVGFGPRKVRGVSDFTDYDTCHWFLRKTAFNTSKLCNKSRMLALTIMVNGPMIAGKENVEPPAGMTVEDIKDPNKVAAWVEAHANVRCIDFITYKNKKSPWTMATIIFERKEKVCKDMKALVYSLLKAGKSSLDVALETKYPMASIRAMKAHLHPSFKKHHKKSFAGK